MIIILWYYDHNIIINIIISYFPEASFICVFFKCIFRLTFQNSLIHFFMDQPQMNTECHL